MHANAVFATDRRSSRLHNNRRPMRRVEVAELVLLAAALAVGLLLIAALLLQYCRRQSTTTKPSPELPISRPGGRPTAAKRSCLIHHLLDLCSGRRRARVEPAASATANPDPHPAAEAAAASHPEMEDVARWFGQASRALYTIDEEEDEECSTEDEGERPEPETPFYTPPVSPTRLFY